jgi:hypothetical protein
MLSGSQHGPSVEVTDDRYDYGLKDIEQVAPLLFRLVFSLLSSSLRRASHIWFEREDRLLWRDVLEDNIPSSLKRLWGLPGILRITQPQPNQMPPIFAISTVIQL